MQIYGLFSPLVLSMFRIGKSGNRNCKMYKQQRIRPEFNGQFSKFLSVKVVVNPVIYISTERIKGGTFAAVIKQYKLWI